MTIDPGRVGIPLAVWTGWRCAKGRLPMSRP